MRKPGSLSDPVPEDTQKVLKSRALSIQYQGFISTWLGIVSLLGYFEFISLWVCNTTSHPVIVGSWVVGIARGHSVYYAWWRWEGL